MKVLVIGGGGREHAVCRALSRSKSVTRLLCAPGNGGIASVAECVPIAATDVAAVVDYAKKNAVDFVVVTPDDPLALGMVDALEEAGIPAFGPKKNAAVIESSKVFSKNLMRKYGIPTAEYEVFDDLASAESYIRKKGAPIVVKADGLALGKGVVVAETMEQALAALREMMVEKKFGESGNRVVIEEYMTGPEVTVLAFTDGKTIRPMPSSQDHKRVFDGNRGPNTGGMGAFTPSPYYTVEIAEECMNTIFRPTVEAMNKEGRPFKGVLYFGLMLTPKGPRVVEYNARFGDPETQPLLTLLESDLMEIFQAVREERLEEADTRFRNEAACCVVLASGGYPGSYEKGFEIKGLDKVPEDIVVYHAGTVLDGGVYRTSGGRVLGVTATGPTLAKAAKRAYDGVACISFQNMHYRKDIAQNL